MKTIVYVVLGYVALYSVIWLHEVGHAFFTSFTDARDASCTCRLNRICSFRHPVLSMRNLPTICRPEGIWWFLMAELE